MDIKWQYKPANPRLELDLSFLELEALSNCFDNRLRKLSPVEFRLERTSEFIPDGSKTEASELQSNLSENGEERVQMYQLEVRTLGFKTGVIST